jgi:hypothetical protein
MGVTANVRDMRWGLSLLVLALVLAGCGSSSSGGSGGGGTKATSLSVKVDHAKADFSAGKITATVHVSEGGHPGEHLALRYGLVDAVSGVRASEEEKLAARYTTTSTVESHDVTVTIPKPVPTDYIVHFALYAPDGSYLASDDSNVFTVPS